MASRFVIAVALFAVCQSSVVDVAYRGKRSFTNAEGLAESGNGVNQASAAVDGNISKAYGITSDGGKALAKATTSDSTNNYVAPSSYVAIEPAYQPAYYPVPAPATVVTYQKNFDTPAVISYDTPQGGASASSNAQGTGQNTASSLAQTNGVNPEPTIVAAKNQGYYAAYNPAQNSASSNANVKGQGTASSFAHNSPVPKSISWRFGTAYDLPAGYAKNTASNYGSANANSNVNSGYVSLKSNANSQDAGYAQSTANTDGARYGTNSAVYSNGGTANANADINNANYYAFRRAGDNYSVNSSANSRGQGSAKSSAIANPGPYVYQPTRTISEAQSNGYGNAASFANTQGNNYRQVNSAVNSFGWGSANAKAYSA